MKNSQSNNYIYNYKIFVGINKNDELYIRL